MQQIIRPGDIVQVDPESKHKRYWACLVFVASINEEDELMNGIIIIPDNRGTVTEEVTLPLEDVHFLTTAKWAPDECIRNRT